MQHLYRHFDANGELLYVGISLSAINRLAQHKGASHWFNEIARVDITCYPDRKSVIDAESAAITNENPKHNLKRPPQSVMSDAQAEASRRNLVSRIVQFNPMYSVQEASKVLAIPDQKVKELIRLGKLSAISDGIRNTKSGPRPKFKITGWQLIDFIEQWQAGAISV